MSNEFVMLSINCRHLVNVNLSVCQYDRYVVLLYATSWCRLFCVFYVFLRISNVNILSNISPASFQKSIIDFRGLLINNTSVQNKKDMRMVLGHLTKTKKEQKNN